MSAVLNVITIKPYQYPKVSVKTLISLCASTPGAINHVSYIGLRAAEEIKVRVLMQDVAYKFFFLFHFYILLLCQSATSKVRRFCVF